jgi:hypothetical protein
MAGTDPIQPISSRVPPVEAVDLSPQVDRRDRRRRRRPKPEPQDPEREQQAVTVDDDGMQHIDLLA